MRITALRLGFAAVLLACFAAPAPAETLTIGGPADTPALREFLEFIAGAEGRRILRDAGGLPAAAPGG